MAENEAHAFAKEVCRGNQDALVFCDLYYKYCHSIDDLIDTKIDGRPTLSNEAILGIFAQAALMYNTPFYKAHSELLFGIILMVTNLYADSVAWERDPLEHRRVMADVLRTCGDEMFNMVALICGGWNHCRNVSLRIRERDWMLQHDPDHLKSEGK